MSNDQRRQPPTLFNRLVGSVVSPVVDSVDLDHIVEQIDVNDVVRRVDLEAVIAGLDLDEILDRIDPDRLLDRIDPDRLLDRVDPNRLLDRVDPNRLIVRVDLDAVVQQVDLDAAIRRVDLDAIVDTIDLQRAISSLELDEIVDRIDLDRLVDRLDLNRIIARVDLNELIDRLDLDRVIARVDIDALVARLDIDAVIDRLDIDRIIARVDLDAVIDTIDLDRAIARVDLDAVVARVDLDRALERVDVNAVVERTELGSIIARSTTGVFGQLLDVARTQVMGVDQVAHAVPARLLRGSPRELPPAPVETDPPIELPTDRILTSGERAVAMQGRYAGSVSRFLAFLVDQFAIGTLFGLGALLVSSAFTVVIGDQLTLSDDRFLVVVAYATWAFAYYAATQAATGRTIGKAIAGILVVDTAGARVSGKAAVLRTLAFPVSFLVFGVGLLIGLFRRDRRELHDLIAGTGVIYAWDAALAERRGTAV